MSLEVYGRLCVFVTPRSASRNATGLARMRRAAVGVQRQHLGRDLLLLGRLLDQRLGELAVLAVLHRPADDVAAVLFPDPLCGRRRWGSTMTGANGPAVAFSGT